MAKKPFEIQNSILRVGGVNLEAGTTTIVIPGVTQASNYGVDEVNDVDDQTVEWDPDLTLYVLDAAELGRLDGDTRSGSYVAAEYTATVDDDGEIDNIEVSVAGTFSSGDKTVAEANMWATQVVDPINNFNINDWVQIPFRPVLRPDDVANVSGGIVERAVEFPYGEDGDTRGTIALAPDGKLYVCVADWQETTQPESFSDTVATQSDVNCFNDRRNGITIILANYPDLELIWDNPKGKFDGLWQVNGYSCTNVFEDGTDLVFEWEFVFGRDSNTIAAGDTFTVTFTVDPLPGAEIWRQLDSGGVFNSNNDTTNSDVYLQTVDRDLSINASRTNDVTSADISISSDDVVNIYGTYSTEIGSDRDIKFFTDGGESFRFTKSQTLTFPDGTSQKTAYVGITEPVVAYKGFEASYARVYENTDDYELAVSKVVIYKKETAPMARADVSDVNVTSRDYFRVNGLGGSDLVAMFVLYSPNWHAHTVSALRSFVQRAIDLVILNNSTEGDINTILGMKEDFYLNYSTLANGIDLDSSFEFYDNNGWSNLVTTNPGDSVGSGLVMSVDVSGTSYTNLTATDPGSAYLSGQRFKIAGDLLGGATPANDLTFTVAVDGSGLVTGFTNVAGTATGGDQTYTTISPSKNDGSSLTIFINAYENDSPVTVYEVGTGVGINNAGTNYRVGDVVTVAGNLFVGGTTPINDATFTVTSVTSGAVSTIEYTSGDIPAIWPDNNINDGGEDQYDTANYIFTSITGDSYQDDDDGDTAIPYNDGEITSPNTAFGPGAESVVVYKRGIFGILANNVEIDWIGTNGNSGADGDSVIDCGSLYRTESPIFRTDGSIELPSMFNTGHEWDYNLNGPTLKLGSTDSQVIITGPEPTSVNVDSRRIVIQGQRGFGEWDTGSTPGEGGDVYIWGGTGGEGDLITDAGGTGGDVKFRGGQGQNSEGGYVKIEGGDAYHWNNSTSGNGGYIEITAGHVNGSSDGGSANNLGGNVSITAGRGWNNTTKSGVVTVTTGGYMANGTPAVHTWTFNNDGNLELPTGGIITNLGDVIGNGAVVEAGDIETIYSDFQGEQSDGPAATTVILNSLYAVGDIINFRTGETRTITQVDADTPEVGAHTYTWVGAVDNSVTNPMFPIIVQTSDYAAAVKPTARIKPDTEYVSLGQYMEIYTGGAPSSMDDLGHIHMKGHTGNVELFLGTDDNFVSTKEAGTTPGHVSMRSETSIKVIETDIRTRRNGSTFVNNLGDGENYSWVRNGPNDITHNTVAADSEGNYYVGGEHTFFADGMVSKFTKDGSLLWTKQLGVDGGNYAWDVPVVAINPTTDRATVLYTTDFDRSFDFFKMVDLDADGNTEGDAKDFYDTDGNVIPRDMKWHSTLGWVIVGQTYGDELTSASLSPETGSGVGKLILNAAATELKGSLMTYNDTSWYLGGTNITGKQLLNDGIGLFTGLSPVNVSSSGSSAVINVRINYASTGSYYGLSISDVTTAGTGYNDGDTFKVLGSQLGGTDGTHDVTFTISTDGVGGGVTGSTAVSGTPNITNVTINTTVLGYTTENFSTGSYIVYRQVASRPFVWTSTWDKFLDTQVGYDFGYATSVDVDTNSGAIYVTGYTNGPENSGGGCGFLWRLTSAGATSWVRGLDVPWEIANAVVDSDGFIYTITSGMTWDITKWHSEGTAVTRITTNGMFGGQPHVATAVDDTGTESLYAVWGNFSSVLAPANGMAVQKFALNQSLHLIWSRHMYLANGNNLYVGYDSDYKHFALTPSQAVVVGYAETLSNQFYDGQLWSLSITDDFEPTAQVGDVNGIVTEVVDLPWAAYGEHTPINLTALMLPQNSSLQVATGTSTFVWNTMSWQNRILNGNFETKGLADIEKINFVQGGDLGHNPVDIPLSIQNLQADDPINWNITLMMSDRGKFIKNKPEPNHGYIQDLTVWVPKSADVPFPVGTVITLMNLDTTGTYYITVEALGWDANSADRPLIWAAGEINESAWSFGGLQTATLMKISNNDWLLTANNVTDIAI